MAGLNTFDNAEQLEALLNKLVRVVVCVGETHLSQPAPKGDAKFFQRQYGKPDGTEDLRYAALAKWPMTKDKVCARRNHALFVTHFPSAGTGYGDL